jgi:hypothetical protein
MAKCTLVTLIGIFLLLNQAIEHPDGWTEDIRITFSGETGGAGKFIYDFQMDREANFYYIGMDHGMDSVFLTKVSAKGELLINEKTILSRQHQAPFWVFLDETRNELNIIHATSDGEIGYTRFDSEGKILIDSLPISDIDLWESFKPIAVIDKDNNLAIYWIEQGLTPSEEPEEIIYKKLNNEGNTLTDATTLLTMNAEVYSSGPSAWASSDYNGSVFIFWKKIESQTYISQYYFCKVDANGNILQNKTLSLLKQAQSSQVWDYETFLGSSDKIYLFTTHTQKYTTPKGQFLRWESYINYTQFDLNGTKVFERTLYPPTNSAVMGSLHVTIDANRKFHLAWDDDKDYEPSGEGAIIGYSPYYPREIYHLTLDPNGDPLGLPIRLTQIDNRNSINPHIFTKGGDLFLIWSDNRYYKGSDNMNGFDIFMKSTAPISFKLHPPSATSSSVLLIVAAVSIISASSVSLVLWRRRRNLACKKSK